MEDHKTDWTPEELARLEKLSERYQEHFTEFRMRWYFSKMGLDGSSVEHIEQFLVWNSRYIEVREQILKDWPKVIPKRMMMELCHRAVEQHKHYLMCSDKAFLAWLKTYGYITAGKKNYINGLSLLDR